MRILILLLLMAMPAFAKTGGYKPVVREGSGFYDKDRVVWLEYTKPLRDDRPLWKKIASSFAIFVQSAEDRSHSRNAAIGIKFTIFF